MLYQALVDTSGVVTLTDERVFGQSGINSIKADAVDDTRVGNRVPQFYRRQGGSATNWDAVGTTTYIPTAVRMQCGVARWTGIAADNGSLTVTLPVAFSYKPIVIAQCFNVPNICAIGYGGAFTNEINISWHDFLGLTYTQVDFTWLAIGPE
jgi:hypothetical protein